MKSSAQLEANYACFCFRLSWNDLIDAMNEQNLSTVAQLREETCAGNACGSCVRNLETLCAPYRPAPSILHLATA